MSAATVLRDRARSRAPHHARRRRRRRCALDPPATRARASTAAHVEVRRLALSHRGRSAAARAGRGRRLRRRSLLLTRARRGARVPSASSALLAAATPSGSPTLAARRPASDCWEVGGGLTRPPGGAPDGRAPGNYSPRAGLGARQPPSRLREATSRAAAEKPGDPLGRRRTTPPGRCAPVGALRGLRPRGVDGTGAAAVDDAGRARPAPHRARARDRALLRARIARRRRREPSMLKRASQAGPFTTRFFRHSGIRARRCARTATASSRAHRRAERTRGLGGGGGRRQRAQRQLMAAIRRTDKQNPQWD